MSNDIPPWESGEPLPDRPSARVIEDSVNIRGHRLTTIEAKMHRFVLAEFNTHRLFSRNSASSRAIPYQKQRAAVLEEPAYPLSWPEEQPGMSGGPPLPDNVRRVCEDIWYDAVNQTLQFGDSLSDQSLHKSVINRLLEPFAWHTVLVTATEWNGFWAQRVSPLAQPEIRACAEEMVKAYTNSVPELRTFDGHNVNGWHLPWVKEDERNEIELSALVKLSAARSCRVSYLTHNRSRDLQADIDLYARLEDPGEGPPHASPLEHPAAADVSNSLKIKITPTRYGIREKQKFLVVPQWGNFVGWCQLRHMVMGAEPQ